VVAEEVTVEVRAIPTVVPVDTAVVQQAVERTAEEEALRMVLVAGMVVGVMDQEPMAAREMLLQVVGVVEEEAEVVILEVVEVIVVAEEDPVSLLVQVPV
jgi:hypothetical protein